MNADDGIPPDATSTTGAGESVPPEHQTLDESVTSALLAMLDSLTPAQRVAFVLHDVFGVPFDAVADIVGRSQHASRALAASARKKVRFRPALETSPSRRQQVIRAFSSAAERADATSLRSLLSPSAMAVTDGAGTPAQGIDDVVQLILRSVAALHPDSVREHDVNGQGGVVIRRAGVVVGVVCLNVRGGLVTDAWIILDEAKLASWNQG